MSEKAKGSEEEFTFKCPTCKKGLIKIEKSIYELHDGDEMLILKFTCDSCNFSKNDIIPVSTKMEPGIMILKVSNENDLKSKVYRSPTGKLEIPELELVVEPGPHADFYFSNIEGVLSRFEEAVAIYRNNLSENDPQKNEIDDILKELQKAMKGQLEITLIITDEEGGSYIIPQDKSKFTFKKLDIKNI